jgi:glycosyltransferase involved in cell wall biosynthesis
MFFPKASVFLTSYNQEKYIREAVLSAVHQDYEKLEVIVVDDASVDNSAEVLTELAGKYPQRLQVIINPTNLGITAAHNIALRKCTGDYVACLDGDDLFLDGKIRRQVAFMEAHPQYAISHHDVEVFSDENQKGEHLYTWRSRFPPKEGGAEVLVRYGNFLCSPSIMVRRDSLPPGGYDERFRSGADWFLWIQTLSLSKKRLGYMDEVLAKYRRHQSNITLNWKAKFDSRLLTLELVKEKYPAYSKERGQYLSDIYVMMSVNLFATRNYSKSIDYLGKAIQCAIPTIWQIFRIPSREMLFLFRNKFVFDDLVKSLFTSPASKRR